MDNKRMADDNGGGTASSWYCEAHCDVMKNSLSLLTALPNSTVLFIDVTFEI